MFEYVCIWTHFNILGFHTESISSVDGYKFNLVDPDITSQHMKLFNVSIQGYTIQKHIFVHLFSITNFQVFLIMVWS